MQVRKHASEGSIMALKPRADITRSSKQGYQWPTKRTHVLQIFFKKIANLESMVPNHQTDLD